MRPTWDETWIAIAVVVARRSLCTRAQVGAVIVSKDNRVVATGYNGPPAGFPHNDLPCTEWCERGKPHNTFYSSGYDDCPSLHAEANALSVCDRREREGGTMYVTGHICYACAKLIANSGLARVVVQPDGERAYRRPEHGQSLLRECGLGVYTVDGTIDMERHDC